MTTLTLLAATVALSGYHVPVIEAPSTSEAFRALGHQVAQDRLWQMELSRRTFRGELAEIMGTPAVASDREILRLGYTDEELAQQINMLPSESRKVFQSYVEGINEAVQEMSAQNKLPSEFATYGIAPRPWTVIDSAAIGVGMAKRFGSGGAGEIRNLLAYGYLKGQPCKDRVADVLDDLLFQNIPSSPVTLNDEDDKFGKPKGVFPEPTREQTLAHLAKLPSTSIFELLPGIRLATQEESQRVALSNAVFNKAGSYAIVLNKARSKTGNNLLLSGPQMGHSDPSIVYESVIKTPNLKVQGISIPGSPMIVVGNTPNFAWGLTTGVADTQDIFYNSIDGESTYISDGKKLQLERLTRTIKVKGQPDQTVVREKTRFGPVVVRSASSGTLFSMKSSFAGRELESFGHFLDLYRAKSASDIFKVSEKLSLGFNLFFATPDDIGYAYCGLIPKRRLDLDPRFPLPGDSASDWRGLVPASRLVRGLNPKSGAFVNWNNKPVSWWPNLDTPAWGELFRNKLILDALPETAGPKELMQVLERVAREEESNGVFSLATALATDRQPASPARNAIKHQLGGYLGDQTEGSIPASMNAFVVREMRTKVFMPHVGNFIQPDLFETALQPSLLLRAWQGKTMYPYLKDDQRTAITTEILNSLEAKPITAGFRAGRIRYQGQEEILYSNRGTFIQVVDVSRGRVSGQSVLGPGQIAGKYDQAKLVKHWLLKPMTTWR